MTLFYFLYKYPHSDTKPIIVYLKEQKREEEEVIEILVWNDNKQRETYTESENNSQELPEQNEQSSFDNRSNRTDDWFFGSRRKEPT